MSKVLLFLKMIAKVMRPSSYCFLDCYEPKEIKYLPNQPLGLSQLHGDKFKHSFQNSLNPDFDHTYASFPCLYVLNQIFCVL